MDNLLVVVLAIALVAAIGVAAWLFMQRRRSEQLREHFGPEYDRALTEHRDPARAERELAHRQERVEQLHIRDLTPAERDHYADAWRRVQARFVDDPNGATDEADALVGEVMEARGYPVGNFEQRAADVSVNHPRVVEHYRAAHSIALENGRGDADTEKLRQALVHYRSLFIELLDVDASADERAAARTSTHREVRS